MNLLKSCLIQFYSELDAYCIDARGFIFGTAIAQNTNKPLVLARKPGKLPGETIEESYDRYGTNTLVFKRVQLNRIVVFQ